MYIWPVRVITFLRMGFDRHTTTRMVIFPANHSWHPSVTILRPNMDNETQADVSFLHSAKALDTVCNSRLNIKLSYHNLWSSVLFCIQAFLFNRVQCCYVNNTLSKCCVSFGVAQGSVMAPILFLIFINGVRATSAPLFVPSQTIVSP